VIIGLRASPPRPLSKSGRGAQFLNVRARAGSDLGQNRLSGFDTAALDSIM
jgi:hypothetical protein